MSRRNPQPSSNNLAAKILFDEAKARLEAIFPHIEAYNSVASALRGMGYGHFDPLGSIDDVLPLTDINVDGMSYTIADVSFLDEIFERGPLGQSERRQSVSSHRARLGKECGWRCFYCTRCGDSQQGPDGRTWHVDHVYPVALGGDDQPDNLVLACATCNLAKKDKTGSQFLREVKRGAPA